MTIAFQDLLTEACAWRRELHAHPELAFNEHRTSEFVSRRLSEFGYRVDRGLAATGVVATLARGNSPRTIAIRADMDALPIQEDTGLPHTSRTPGVMHACGHDGHVAIALAAAKACAALPDLDGVLHFIFQPAEENEGGARRMIEEGLFSRFPCDAVYALHNWPTLPLGACVARDDAMMAALSTFEIAFRGRGCHGALPQEGDDVLLATSQFVMAAHTIVSRDVSSMQAGVVSVTQINGGDTWNTLPSQSRVRGTSRWFDVAVGDIIETRLADLARRIASAYRCTADIVHERRFPPTINNAGAASFIRNAAGATGIVRFVDAAASMTSEDFAFMLERVPGCYLWLGSARSTENHGLHSPLFDFNDDALQTGVQIWIDVVRAALGRA